MQGSLLRRAGTEKAEECSSRANNSSGTVLTAPNFGGVAGRGARSSQSWSCSHNLLPFRAPFSLRQARIPAPIVGLPWSGTKGSDVSPWERAASPSSQGEAETTPSRKLQEWERDSPPLRAVPCLHTHEISSRETRNYLFPASSAERAGFSDSSVTFRLSC